MSVELITSPWRAKFESFLQSVKASLLLATPYIRYREAEWLSNTVAGRKRPEGLEMTVLTNLQADSVLTDTLEIRSLSHFAKRFPRCEIISVPHLHAKVYVADGSSAIVTSANLTTAALDQNAEYGLLLDSDPLVEQIKIDLLSYARLGSPLSFESLQKLEILADELRKRYQEVQSSVSANVRNVFNSKLAELTHDFLATQVGTRTAHAVFAEAIVFLLRKGPLYTRQLHLQIQSLLPELCDDSIELVINGQRFGKQWKHTVRNAQVYLRRQGRMKLEQNRWVLT